MCVYIHKSFSTRVKKEYPKGEKKRRDGKIGKHKLDEMGAQNMK